MSHSEVYVCLSPGEFCALMRGEAVVLTDRGPARSTIRITLAGSAADKAERADGNAQLAALQARIEDDRGYCA